MRLEEWQKFIEAQFLDDASKPEARPEPQPPSAETRVPAPVAASELPAGTAGTNPQTESAPPAEAPLRLVFDEEPVVIAVASAPAEMPPVIECVPAVPIARFDKNKNADDAPAAEVIATPTVPAFGPPPIIEANIPSFDRYFPSARVVVSDNTTELAPTDGEFETQEPVQINSVPTSPPAPTSESDLFEETPISLTSDEAKSRRAPRSRARHAKNVRPEEVPTGLSRTELWAKVPKHVETLLALERLEEEKEIAQFSYKRPFAEKRQELIERLLDPILSLEETARLLNVCPTTIRRYTNKGILTYYRKEPENGGRAGGNAEKETRQRRFRLSDILIFLETQQTAIEEDRRAQSRRAANP